MTAQSSNKLEPLKMAKLPIPSLNGSCEKIEIKFDFGSPRPNAGEGLGGEGDCRTVTACAVLPHQENLFGLSSELDAACTAPSPPARGHPPIARQKNPSFARTIPNSGFVKASFKTHRHFPVAYFFFGITETESGVYRIIS